MQRIFILFLVSFFSLVCIGQTRLNPDIRFGPRIKYELGAGGTNYSDKKPDRYGLRKSHFTGQHHLVGVYVEGAYSLLYNNCGLASSFPGGWSMAAGTVYEYQDYILRVQTGIGMQYQNVANRVSDMLWDDNSVYDAYNYPYHLHYSFYDRTDYVQNAYLQVPLLVGVNYCGFYFLTGFKAGVQLWGSSKIIATGTTAATYNQFFGWYEEMDNHGLRKDVEMVREGQRISLKPTIYASAEIGYEWGEIYKGETGFNAPREKDYRIKVALYADFGINNIHQSDHMKAVYIPTDYKWDFPAYQLNHVFGSDLTTLPPIQIPYTQDKDYNHPQGNIAYYELSKMNNFFVRNINVGIKITLLIGLHTKDKCIICGPYHSERGYQ